jgi:hypothetical protein
MITGPASFPAPSHSPDPPGQLLNKFGYHERPKNMDDYHNLTTKQRIAACVHAHANQDLELHKRLVKNCPPGNDSEFSTGMGLLQMLALEVEQNLIGLALDFTIVNQAGDHETALTALRMIDAVNLAWRLFLEDEGINYHDMVLTYYKPRHFAVESLIRISSGASEAEVKVEYEKMHKRYRP